MRGTTPKGERDGWKTEGGRRLKGADASEEMADREQLTRKAVDTSHVMPAHAKPEVRCNKKISM